MTTQALKRSDEINYPSIAPTIIINLFSVTFPVHMFSTPAKPATNTPQTTLTMKLHRLTYPTGFTQRLRRRKLPSGRPFKRREQGSARALPRPKCRQMEMLLSTGPEIVVRRPTCIRDLSASWSSKFRFWSSRGMHFLPSGFSSLKRSNRSFFASYERTTIRQCSSALSKFRSVNPVQ